MLLLTFVATFVITGLSLVNCADVINAFEDSNHIFISDDLQTIYLLLPHRKVLCPYFVRRINSVGWFRSHSHNQWRLGWTEHLPRASDFSNFLKDNQPTLSVHVDPTCTAAYPEQGLSDLCTYLPVLIEFYNKFERNPYHPRDRWWFDRCYPTKLCFYNRHIRNSYIQKLWSSEVTEMSEDDYDTTISYQPKSPGFFTTIVNAVSDLVTSPSPLHLTSAAPTTQRSTSYSSTHGPDIVDFDYEYYDDQNLKVQDQAQLYHGATIELPVYREKPPTNRTHKAKKITHKRTGEVYFQLVRRDEAEIAKWDREHQPISSTQPPPVGTTPQSAEYRFTRPGEHVRGPHPPFNAPPTHHPHITGVHSSHSSSRAPGTTTAQPATTSSQPVDPSAAPPTAATSTRRPRIKSRGNFSTSHKPAGNEFKISDARNRVRKPNSVTPRLKVLARNNASNYGIPSAPLAGHRNFIDIHINRHSAEENYWGCPKRRHCRISRGWVGFETGPGNHAEPRGAGAVADGLATMAAWSESAPFFNTDTRPATSYPVNQWTGWKEYIRNTPHTGGLYLTRITNDGLYQSAALQFTTRNEPSGASTTTSTTAAPDIADDPSLWLDGDREISGSFRICTTVCDNRKSDDHAKKQSDNGLSDDDSQSEREHGEVRGKHERVRKRKSANPIKRQSIDSDPTPRWNLRERGHGGTGKRGT